MENIENVGGPKCWLFTQATSNTPFDFHIFIHYLQVDKLTLSNTSTTVLHVLISALTGQCNRTVCVTPK